MVNLPVHPSDFKDIRYLKHGNDKQKQAYKILTDHRILKILKPYNPVLVGTIPINIDIETSDLDIICEYRSRDEFLQYITRHFDTMSHFRVYETVKHKAVVAHFSIDDFEIELFGQDIPTLQQNAYRHMVVEYQLLRRYGEPLRQKIVELKKQGIKTEPAFAQTLGLTGDPYAALLELKV